MAYNHFLHVQESPDWDTGCMHNEGEKAEFIWIKEHFSHLFCMQDVPNMGFPRKRGT